MPASRKVSIQQVEILLNYLEEHSAMAKGQAVNNPQAKAAVRSLWEELAATLNAQGTGVHKSASEWRDPEFVPRTPSPSPQPPSPSPQPPSPSHEVDVPLYHPVSPLPSTSRAPLVQAGSSSAEAASPAAKKRKSGAPGTASTVEIPQPRWAWEAEQDRRALDERRLRVEERLADAIESMAGSMASRLDVDQRLADAMTSMARTMASRLEVEQRLADSIASLVGALASIVENNLNNGC